MNRTTVRQLMIKEVVTLRKEQAVPMAEELIRMLHIRHLPVVDEHKRLVGIVTHRSLLAAHVELLSGVGKTRGADVDLTIPISKVMTTDVEWVTPDTFAVEALELMLRAKVGSLPVVEDGRVVGIVTSRDFLAYEAKKLRHEHGNGEGAQAIEQVSRQVLATVDARLKQLSPPAQRLGAVPAVLGGLVVVALGLVLWTLYETRSACISARAPRETQAPLTALPVPSPGQDERAADDHRPAAEVGGQVAQPPPADPGDVRVAMKRPPFRRGAPAPSAPAPSAPVPSAPAPSTPVTWSNGVESLGLPKIAAKPAPAPDASVAKPPPADWKPQAAPKPVVGRRKRWIPERTRNDYRGQGWPR